jgi:hypothetical protein
VAAQQGRPRSCHGHTLDARDGARSRTFMDVDGEVSCLAGLRTRLKDSIAPIELRGTPSEEVYDFDVRR